jgi:hypothetical protein
VRCVQYNKKSGAAVSGGGAQQLVQLHSVTVSGATLSQTGISAAYKDLIVKGTNLSMDTGTRYPRIQIQDSGGAGQSVVQVRVDDSGNTTYTTTPEGSGAVADQAYAFYSGVTIAAANTFDFEIIVHDYATTGMYKRYSGWYKDSVNTDFMMFEGVIKTTNAISVVHLDINNTGNFDGVGSLIIYGRM